MPPRLSLTHGKNESSPATLEASKSHLSHFGRVLHSGDPIPTVDWPADRIDDPRTVPRCDSPGLSRPKVPCNWLRSPYRPVAWKPHMEARTSYSWVRKARTSSSLAACCVISAVD